MAKTHIVHPVGVFGPQSTRLSYAALNLPEGASQTFSAGSPVEFASGLIVVQATDPVDDASPTFGIAIEDGENVASGGRSKVVPLADNIYVYANLLTGDGDDLTYAATHMGVVYALSSKSAIARTGITDWFLDAADTGGGGFFVCGDYADITVANVNNGNLAEVGDTNARVACVLTPASRQVI